jgi:hypothetical protein
VGGGSCLPCLKRLEAEEAKDLAGVMEEMAAGVGSVEVKVEATEEEEVEAEEEGEEEL